jgi:RNA polymerase sigma-70 factor, ECF subfamily
MIINALYHQAPDVIKSEFDWIEQAKLDPQKFGRLYTKYYDQIFRYVNQRLDCEDLASDVTSQVFFKAFCNLHKYQFKGVPFSSWLYRIAKSEVYQAFRDHSKHQAVNFDTLDFATFFDSYHEEENEDNIKRLQICLKELKVGEFEIIKLRFYEKQSFKEIGDFLGISENNAKVKCFRSVSKLKKLYFKS